MSFVAPIEADVSKWGPNLDKAGKDFNNFANRAKQDFDKVSRAQKGAGTVAMEFNRIIQDAPFGMMGISNNLTQLTDNYKNYAQSVKQAALEQGKSVSNFQIFKGAVAGILSPINLFSLGISAVTSGLILYQQWQQRSKKVTKENTDKIKELVDNLNSLSTAMYKAAQSSGNEEAQLKTLYKISTDVNQSTNARKKAAKDLIDQYPALFGKFSTEQVMLGKAKTAYDEVSKSIIATARAQAAYGQISEKAGQQLAIDETNNGIREQISLLNKRLEIEKRNIEASTSSAAGNAGVGASSAAAYGTLAKLEEKVLGLNKSVSSNLLERAKLQEQINKLEEFAVVNQAKTIDLTDKNNNKTKELTDTVSKLMNELNGSALSEYDRKIFEIGVKYDGIFKSIKNIRDTSQQADAFGLATQAKQFELLNARAERFIETTSKIGDGGLKGLTNNIVSFPIEAKVTADFSNLNNQLSGVKTTIQTLVLDLQSVVGNGISDMMSTLGNTIANGGNWLEGIGKGILSAMGGLAKSIGEQMIAFGVAGLALKKLMLNPFLSIAAGAALVALGSFASSSIGSQTSNFNGTNASSYGSSINSSQSFMPRGAYYNNDKQIVNLKIEGNNLVGSYAINKDRNSRSK